MQYCTVLLALLLTFIPGCGPDGGTQVELTPTGCTITWDYDTPALFNIYHSTTANIAGQGIAPALTVSERRATCEQVGVPDDHNPHFFTVTAVVDGLESLHSSEVSFQR